MRRVILVWTFLFFGFQLALRAAENKPSATVVSPDTAFCVSGTTPFTVRFSGTPPFGISYTLKYKDGTQITYQKINQNDYIQISDCVVDTDTTWTVLLSDSKSFEVVINKVFDSTIPFAPATDPPAWDLSSGSTFITGKMTVRIDTIPEPFAGNDSVVCNYATELKGRKSLSSNLCLWSAIGGVVFDDPTVTNPIVTVPAEGDYTFKLKEIAGKCSKDTTVDYHFNGYASVALSGFAEVCVTGQLSYTLTSTANFPIQYVLTDGSAFTGTLYANEGNYNTSIAVSGDKIYTLSSVVDANGCVSPAQHRTGQAVSVNLQPKPFAGDDQTVCGNQINVSATSDMGAGWWSGNGTFDDSTSISTKFTSNVYDQNRVYWNEVNKGCLGTSSFVAEFFKSPVSDAGKDQKLFMDTQTTLEGNNPEYGLGTWSSPTAGVVINAPNDYNSLVTSLPLGKSEFYWKIENGICPSSTDTVHIFVKEFTYSTGFSPNGDGFNDKFEIFGLIQRPVANNELKIFDASGRLLYSTKNYDNSWDGTDQSGNPLPTGTYYYQFTGDGIEPVQNYLIIKRE